MRNEGGKSESRKRNILSSLWSRLLAHASNPFPLLCGSTVPAEDTAENCLSLNKSPFTVLRGTLQTSLVLLKSSHSMLWRKYFSFVGQWDTVSLFNPAKLTQSYFPLSGGWTCCLSTWGGSVCRWGWTMPGCSLIHCQQ